MRSEIVERNYAELWPRVVAAAYKDHTEQEQVKAILLGFEGPEPDRVRLGILKASNCNVAQIERLLQVAQADWRDLLCEAEYPLSSTRWGLKEKAPEKYDALLAKEQMQYEHWLRSVLAT